MSTMVKFPLQDTMAQASVYQWENGTSAFKADGTMVMLDNEPRCSASFRLTKLEEWLVTLEEIIPTAPPAHMYHLQDLYFALKGARLQAEKDHEEMLTESPTADDLMAYLIAYTAAIGATK